MLNILLILGEDELHEVYEEFRNLNPAVLTGKNEEATDYLRRLHPYFVLSFQAVIEGNIEKSVDKAYSLGSFKQQTYRSKGLSYVLNYQKTLKEITGEPALK